MDSPDICYIIPVFNAGQYLGECLDSILSQTGPYRRRIIVVDDGSTDDSPAVCRRYADAHYEIQCLSPGHGGVSFARNTGTAAADSQYIAFVDADDTLSPDFERFHLDAAKKYGADVVIGGVYCGTSPRFTNTGRCHVLTARQALLSTLCQRKKMIPAPWGRIFRLGAIRHIAFIEGRRYEDLEWTPRMLTQIDTPVVRLDDVLYFYRKNPSSFINTPSAERLDALYMADRVVETMAATGDKALIAAAHERRFSANFNILRLFRNDNAVVDRCWSVIKAERLKSLLGRNIRLKSRLGALLSYAGKSIIRRL